MKIYPFHTSNPFSRTFLQIFSLTNEGQTEVQSPEEADLILLVGTEDLRSLYEKFGGTKFLAAVDHRRLTGGPLPKQPPSVFLMDGYNLMKGDQSAAAMVKQYEAWKQTPQLPSRALAPVAEVAKLSRSYSVLVVDDSSENLARAVQVLPGQKLLLAQNMCDARRYYQLGGLDAVLTDLNMPPDRAYSAINLDRYGVAETEKVGMSVVFEATALGIPAAIVTDANHHQDWFSAMFDQVKGATVNGQRVLFRNDSDKRWDMALKALMEPDSVT